MEDCVIKVKDDHCFIIAQETLDVHLLMLLEGTSSYQDIASACLMLKKVTSKGIQMFLLDLFHAKLAPSFKNLLMFADHLPNFDDNWVLSEFFPILVKVDQKGCLCKVGQIYLLVIHFSNLSCWCKLFVDCNAPWKLGKQHRNINDRVYLANLP